MTSTLDAPPAPRRRRAVGSRRALVVVAVIVGALAFLVSKGLGDATVYFKTADEAVDEKAALGERPFRVEGLVTEPVARDGDLVRFSIISAGVCMPVRHTGDPPELFKPGIPVVLEGRWQGDTYASERIFVKHTPEYRADNEERLEQAASEQYATCEV